VNKNKQSTTATQNTAQTDSSSIIDGQGNMALTGGSFINIETLDPDTVAGVLGLAESLSLSVVGGAQGQTQTLVKALADKEASQSALVNAFRAQADNTQTTLRDTLATALNSPILAGPADASGNAMSFARANPLPTLAAALLVVFILAKTFGRERSKK